MGLVFSCFCEKSGQVTAARAYFSNVAKAYLLQSRPGKRNLVVEVLMGREVLREVPFC